MFHRSFFVTPLKCLEMRAESLFNLSMAPPVLNFTVLPCDSDVICLVGCVACHRRC